jgi:phenylalanyl-tRNA synthetase alpha subunit
MMGLNVKKAKNKVNSKSGNSRGAGSTRKSNGGKDQEKMKHSEKMDFLNYGLDAVTSVAGLVNTIVSSKNETEQARIASNQKQKELDHDLEKLKAELGAKADEMKMQLEKSKLKNQVDLKKIDQEMQAAEDAEVTKRELIQASHKEKMIVLNMQRDAVNMIMEIYKKYYEELFSGRTTLVFPDDLGIQMRQCIMTINTALQSGTEPQNRQYIEMEE